MTRLKVSSQSIRVRPAFVTALVCSVLFAGTALLFSRTLGYGFLNYDDPRYLTGNLHVQAGLEWTSIVWAFTGLTDYWHPLSWMSHMLDWGLFGDAAAGHHLTSILWHAANAVLVFLVTRRLTGSRWLSAFSAALFAWHPLRVESVAWVTERKDVMSGFFFLLTLWAYAAYAARRQEGRRSAGLYVATLVVFACGLMSKPMLVSVPVVLLLLDFWPLRRVQLPGTWRTTRNLLVEKLPFIGLSVMVSVVTMLMQVDHGGFVLDLTLPDRMGNAVVSVVRYLGKFFWPVDLVVCYPHPGQWPWFWVCGAALLTVFISTVAWMRRGTEPWLLTGWGWFLVMLTPVIGLVQAGFQAMADRYTYLPILGWQLACLCPLRGLRTRGPTRLLVGVAGGIVLAVLAAATWRQERYWKDSTTLFEHAVAVDDRNAVAHGFLGYTFLLVGRAEEAETHCRKALELDPQNSIALFALGNLSQQRGDPSGAIATYETLLQIDPRSEAARFELGQLLLKLGRVDEATRHLREAARANPEITAQSLSNGERELRRGRFERALIHFQTACIAAPEDATAHFGSGFALARLGRDKEALVELEKAAALKPGEAGTEVEIGLVFMSRDEPAEALRHFQAATAAEENLGVAHLGVARALVRLGRLDEASASFGSALKHLPDDPEVEKGWAEALARNREFERAAAHYARAVELAPRDAGAHAGYGYMLVFTGRPGEAIREWEEALRLNPDFPGLRERLDGLRRSVER